MKERFNTILSVALVGTALFWGNSFAAAQTPAAQPQAPAQTDKSKENTIQLPVDKTPPASAEEGKAYKAFQDVPGTDADKKIKAGEEFLQKYPQSQYRATVYSNLVPEYLDKGDVAKVVDAGDKDLAINPNDAPVLAIEGFAIARSFNRNAPDAGQQLTKAEQLTKKAIEITPTLPKPEKLTDAAYQSAKNDTLSIAYSGLGLVYVHAGKFAEAIPALQQSIKLDTHPEPDPANYYLLGVANQRTSHFDDAVQAYNRCAAIAGGLQAQCKSGAADAKKQSATQLSAPK